MPPSVGRRNSRFWRLRFCYAIDCSAGRAVTGRTAVDFTSALYLGFAHESASLRWNQLTTGVPAGLRRATEAAEPELGFAALVGCERAVALPSTLHAFLGSVRPGVPGRRLDPVRLRRLSGGSHRHRARRGARYFSREIRHHDPEDLARRLGRLPGRARPWIVTDGFCPGCLQLPPLVDYGRLIAARAGRLLIDDTQASACSAVP